MEISESVKSRLITGLTVLGVTLAGTGAYLQFSPSYQLHPQQELGIEEKIEEDQKDSKSIQINQKESQGSESAKEIKELNIDVSGAVALPGVYKLKVTDRLTNALEAAGGLSKNADQSWVARNLNLASKLQDGDKVYIPSKGEAKEPPMKQPTQPPTALTPTSFVATTQVQGIPEVAGISTGALGVSSGTLPPQPSQTHN